MGTRPLILAAALAGSGIAAVSALGADQTVTATPSNDFTPSSVTVTQGETVTWKNDGGDHNVKFDDGSFEEPSSASSSAWTVSRRFDTPGTFRYYCEEHGGPGGSGMSGTVTVQAAAGTPPPPTLTRMSVTLRVSDRTPRRGQRVRFYGSVRPQHDGRIVQIQRRRSGRFRTVARARLRDAGDARSRFSRRLRVYRDGVYRARVPADGDHLTGISRRRRLDVP